MSTSQRMGVGLGVLCSVTMVSLGQVFTFNTPSDDRWHYPFNFSPGTRTSASTFSAVGNFEFGFNDRDGMVYVAWDTTSGIDPNLPLEDYGIASVRVIMTNQVNQFLSPDWPIDLTVDEWFTHDVNGDGMINADGLDRTDPNDTDGESDDLDPGRPLELFGLEFGSTFNFDPANWNEFSIYIGGTQTTNFPRDPFPFVFQPVSFLQLHVEDSVQGLHNGSAVPPVTAFTPTPWAIGAPQGYTPGSQSTPFEVWFDVALDQSAGAVRDYFRADLQRGRVIVAIATLRETVIMGSTSSLPSFYMKEGLFDPGSQAGKLVIEVCTPPQFDLNASCCVDTNDGLAAIGCLSGPAGGLTGLCDAFDADTDIDVDMADYSVLQAAMGSCASGI